jgi:hypothetical protein
MLAFELCLRRQVSREWRVKLGLILLIYRVFSMERQHCPSGRPRESPIISKLVFGISPTPCYDPLLAIFFCLQGMPNQKDTGEDQLASDHLSVPKQKSKLHA